MKIVAISDVHERWHNLHIPECDVLISAGDYSFRGDLSVVREFHKWLHLQPSKHVISVQGNHELWVERNYGLSKLVAEESCPGVHFLEEGDVEIDGIKFYGSAITPRFFNWAYNRDRGLDIKKHWDKIPDNTDILITHGPPKGIMDLTPDYENVGCDDLLKRVSEINPKYHIFGHLHGCYGILKRYNTTFINASICDEDYKASNKPIEFEVTK